MSDSPIMLKTETGEIPASEFIKNDVKAKPIVLGTKLFTLIDKSIVVPNTQAVFTANSYV